MSWNNNPNNAQPEAQPQATAAGAQAEPKADAMFGNRFDSLFDMACATASGTASCDAVNAIVDALNAIAVRPEHKPLGLKFLLVNRRGSAGLPFILGFNTHGGKTGHFTYLLEELIYSGKLTNKRVNVQGQSVEIDRDTSLFYDDDLIELAVRVIKEDSKLDSTPCGNMVVKSQRNLKAEGYPAILFDTAKTAILNFLGRPSLKACQLTNRALRVNVLNEVTPGNNVLDMEGNPITSDFTITMSAAPEHEPNERLNKLQQSMRLSRLSGYVDLLRVNQQMSQLPMNNGMPVYIPAYHPYLVVTDVTGMSETGDALEDPTTNILGLLSLGVQMASGSNFLSVFRRGNATGSKTSLGVLGYDHQPDINLPLEPKELEVQNGLMGQAGRNDVTTVDSIARQFFYPDSLTVAVDIRKGGRNSWTQQMFLAAAMGIEGANEALIDIIDDFCMGNFKPLWGNQPVFQSDIVTIHAGTYQNEAGELRDIRDFDYLKVTGLYKQEAPTQMPDYAQTFLPGFSNGDLGAISLDYRRRVLQQLAGAEIEGLYDRVFLTPGLLNAFMDAVCATGLKVVSEGLYDPQEVRYSGGNFRAGTAVQANGVYAAAGNGMPAGGQYLHRGWRG